MGQALETFADTYTELLQDRFQTKNKSRDQIIDELEKLNQQSKSKESTASDEEMLKLANYRRDMRSV